MIVFKSINWHGSKKFWRIKLKDSKGNLLSYNLYLPHRTEITFIKHFYKKLYN